MKYVEWTFFALQGFIVFWSLSFILRFFLPEHIRDALERMDLFLLEAISSIPVLLSNTWFFAATILYFLGNFAVLLLLVFGLFMLGFSIQQNLGDVEFTWAWWFQLSSRLVEEKTAWSGATMIVGTTAAIGHMWKLNLDKKQYFEKIEKERQEKYEERRKRESERAKKRAHDLM